MSAVANSILLQYLLLPVLWTAAEQIIEQLWKETNTVTLLKEEG